MLTLMELEYLLAPLYLSAKVCADIINFYCPNARDFGWTRLLSRSGIQKARDKSVKVITHFDDLKILFPGNPILEENSGSSQVWVVYNFIYLVYKYVHIFSLSLFVVIWILLVLCTEYARFEDICVFSKSSSTRPKCCFKAQWWFVNDCFVIMPT